MADKFLGVFTVWRILRLWNPFLSQLGQPENEDTDDLDEDEDDHDDGADPWGTPQWLLLTPAPPSVLLAEFLEGRVHLLWVLLYQPDVFYEIQSLEIRKNVAVLSAPCFCFFFSTDPSSLLALLLLKVASAKSLSSFTSLIIFIVIVIIYIIFQSINSFTSLLSCLLAISYSSSGPSSDV